MAHWTRPHVQVATRRASSLLLRTSVARQAQLITAEALVGCSESHPCGRGHRVLAPANEHKRHSEAGCDDVGSRRDEHLEKQSDELSATRTQRSASEEQVLFRRLGQTERRGLAGSGSRRGAAEGQWVKGACRLRRGVASLASENSEPRTGSGFWRWEAGLSLSPLGNFT